MFFWLVWLRISGLVNLWHLLFLFHAKLDHFFQILLCRIRSGPFLKMIKQIIKVWMMIRISWTYFYPVAHHLCKSSLPLSGPIQPWRPKAVMRLSCLHTEKWLSKTSYLTLLYIASFERSRRSFYEIKLRANTLITLAFVQRLKLALKIQGEDAIDPESKVWFKWFYFSL